MIPCSLRELFFTTFILLLTQILGLAWCEKKETEINFLDTVSVGNETFNATDFFEASDYMVPVELTFNGSILDLKIKAIPSTPEYKCVMNIRIRSAKSDIILKNLTKSECHSLECSNGINILFTDQGKELNMTIFESLRLELLLDCCDCNKNTHMKGRMFLETDLFSVQVRVHDDDDPLLADKVSRIEAMYQMSPRIGVFETTKEIPRLGSRATYDQLSEEEKKDFIVQDVPEPEKIDLSVFDNEVKIEDFKALPGRPAASRINIKESKVFPKPPAVSRENIEDFKALSDPSAAWEPLQATKEENFSLLTDIPFYFLIVVVLQILL